MIERYESYLVFKFSKVNEKISIVSFNIIQPLNYSSRLNTFLISGLDVSIYQYVQKIYTLSEVIRAIIEKAYVLKTTKTKENKNIVYTQNRIVSEFYWRATSFMQVHLEDIYKKFNLIYDAIQSYAENSNFRFPDDIEKFEKDYVLDKIKELNLIKQN